MGELTNIPNELKRSIADQLPRTQSDHEIQSAKYDIRETPNEEGGKTVRAVFILDDDKDPRNGFIRFQVNALFKKDRTFDMALGKVECLGSFPATTTATPNSCPKGSANDLYSWRLRWQDETAIGKLLVGLLPPPIPSAILALAVFDVEDSTKRFDLAITDKLTEYLIARLAELTAYSIVPRDQLRAHLREEKSEGYRPCFDQSCQMDLGKAIAAAKVLSTKLLLVGDSCIITSTLSDLKTETVERGGGASVKTACDETSLVGGIDKIIERLAARKTAP